MEWSGFDTPEINERPPGVEPPATTVFAPVALNDQVLFVVSHGQALTTLYRVEGESVKPVELSPTSGALVQAFNPGLLLSTGDSLLAYAEGSVWRTTDGSQWSRISSQFLDGRPSSEDALVTTLSDRFVYTPVEFGSFIAEAWESTDGVTWDPAPVAPPPQTNLVRLDTGWFAAGGSVSGEIHGNSWWMLVSDEWVSLEAMGTEECFVATPIALGGFTLLSGVGCGPDTEDLLDLWLVTLDEE